MLDLLDLKRAMFTKEYCNISNKSFGQNPSRHAYNCSVTPFTSDTSIIIMFK